MENIFVSLVSNSDFHSNERTIGRWVWGAKKGVRRWVGGLGHGKSGTPPYIRPLCCNKISWHDYINRMHEWTTILVICLPPKLCCQTENYIYMYMYETTRMVGGGGIGTNINAILSQGNTRLKETLSFKADYLRLHRIGIEFHVELKQLIYIPFRSKLDLHCFFLSSSPKRKPHLSKPPNISVL